MAYKYNDDDVIIFDLFDDEGYKAWQEKVRESANDAIESSENGDDEGQTESDEVTDFSISFEPLDTADHDANEAVISGVHDEPSQAASDDISAGDEITAAESEQENSTRTRIKHIAELLAYVAVAVLIVIMVPKYVMERVSVDGTSMNNTLSDGDQLIGEKLSVRFKRLKRFDIIYFHPNGNTKIEPYIKRIIGLPGDTVRIEDSVVYINGMPLQEDYAAEPEFKAYNASETIWLGENEYFVLGDNRNHSTDSRSSVGKVKLSDIEGRAVFRIWPITEFGNID